MENNLDITLQRYNLSIADTDILLTSSGAADPRRECRVVQGTPGGADRLDIHRRHRQRLDRSHRHGSGRHPGWRRRRGRRRTAGLVSSTLGAGPPIDNFDPVLIGSTLQGERATTPQSTTIFTGTTSLIQNTNTYNFQLHSGFLHRHLGYCGLQQQSSSPPIRSFPWSRRN